jgi:O-antigen/teichoic acid export membrane protein
MQTHRVASNSIFVLAAEAIDFVMRFALVIIAARALGDEDFGKISFAIAFGTLFLILSDLGLNHLLIREIAKKPQEVQRLIGSGLVIKLILAAFTFFAIFVAAQFTHKPANVLYSVYILAATLILGSFGDFFTTVFQGFQQLKYDAVASMIMSISNTVIGVIILLFGGDFLDLSWVYLLSRALRLAYCLVMVRFKFTHIKLVFEKTLTKFFLKEGTGFGVIRFFSTIYTYVSTTMLSLMVGDAAVGWYNVAYRLIFAMMVLPMGVTRAVYPALSASFKSDPEAFTNIFAKTFKLMFITGTVAATFLSMLAEPIIVTLFGSEYRNAADALRILVWATAFYYIGTIMTHTSRATGHQNYTARVVGASAILNVILNFILIPRYSFVGASFAALMSEFLTFGLHLWFVERYILKTPFFRLLPRVAVVNLVTMLLLWQLIDFQIFIAIGLALPVTAALVFITGFFTKEEVAALLGTMKALKG